MLPRMICMPLFAIAVLFAGCASTSKNYDALIEEVESYAIKGEIEAEYEQIWKAVRAVLKSGAVITEESLVEGRIKAERNQTIIDVQLTQIKMAYGILTIRVFDKQTRESDLVEAKRLFEEMELLVDHIRAQEL